MKNLLILLFVIPLISIAQEKVTWDYPMKPGSEEWKELNSFSERLNAFNIPEDILTEMSTENLVKTCLNYPWWILITSRDNNQAGYEYLKAVFNGFSELERRKNAGEELLKVYEKMMPQDINRFSSLVEQGMFSFQFTYIELLLAQQETLKNINTEDLVLLIQKASSAYNVKSELFDKYSYYGIATSCLILARTLELKRYREFELLGNNFPELMTFNNKGNSSNKELLDRIHTDVINLYKK